MDKKHTGKNTRRLHSDGFMVIKLWVIFISLKNIYNTYYIYVYIIIYEICTIFLFVRFPEPGSLPDR